MSDILPYKGFPVRVESALQRLETSSVFDESAYCVLLAERNRPAPIFLIVALPIWLVGAGLIWAIQNAGWLAPNAPWAYAFGAILFLALVMWPLRRNAARDDARLGAALKKWRDQAQRVGLRSEQGAPTSAVHGNCGP